MAQRMQLDRREFLALGAAALAAPFVHATDAASPPPNIVYILTDDLGWADLGCYGSRFHETPHLDALATEGLRFTQAYAACPVCSPSRAAILTGQYPARIGLTDFLGGKRSPDDSTLRPASYVKHLPLTLTTLPALLRAQGYATAAIGKWHLGGADAPPTVFGFDVSLGSEMGGGVAGYFGPKWRAGNVLVPKDDNEYLTDRLTDEACGYIRAQAGHPFFLYLSHFAPHIPLQAPADLVARFEEKKKAMGADIGPQNNPLYAAMLSALDTGVGRVLDALRESGQADNTIVIFTSDNGGLNVLEGANTPATSNAPLREGKGYLYEGGTRVPLIVRWPGVCPAANVSESQVIGVDFLPTLCAAVGVPKESLPPNLDGISVLGALQDPKSVPAMRDIFWHYPHFSNQGGRPGTSIRRGDWKLIEWHEGPRVELFDLSQDLGETQDVSATNPERKQELLAALQAWRERVGAQMPSPKA